MSPNPWIQHLQKVWQVEKPKGTSYKATMSIAKKSYRKGSKAAPKNGRRRPKKKAQ